MQKNGIQASVLPHTVPPKYKISLALFSSVISSNKKHQIYNLIKQKDSLERNRNNSLEFKCGIARMELDYRLIILDYV